MDASREEPLSCFVWQPETLRLSNLALCLLPAFVHPGCDRREIVRRDRSWMLAGQCLRRIAESERFLRALRAAFSAASTCDSVHVRRCRTRSGFTRAAVSALS